MSRTVLQEAEGEIPSAYFPPLMGVCGGAADPAATEKEPTASSLSRPRRKRTVRCKLPFYGIDVHQPDHQGAEIRSGI